MVRFCGLTLLMPSLLRRPFTLILFSLLLAALVGACGSPASDVSSGSPAATPVAPSPTVPPDVLPATPSTSPSPVPSQVPPTPVPSPTPPTPTPLPTGHSVGLPTRIQIPSIGVDTAFEYVGLLPDGVMDAPKDPTKAGWYRLGPRPGDSGNAVIAGHVDWGGKLMPFFGLKSLGPGDIVTVTTGDGHTSDFAVQTTKWYEAEDAPVAEIFASSNTPEITLITCGGTFDRAKRLYLDRLVVRATLR
jgi:LPXTG-site transpeptidase (sortase) family protein